MFVCLKLHVTLYCWVSQSDKMLLQVFCLPLSLMWGRLTSWLHSLVCFAMLRVALWVSRDPSSDLCRALLVKFLCWLWGDSKCTPTTCFMPLSKLFRYARIFTLLMCYAFTWGWLVSFIKSILPIHGNYIVQFAFILVWLRIIPAW